MSAGRTNDNQSPATSPDLTLTQAPATVPPNTPDRLLECTVNDMDVNTKAPDIEDRTDDNQPTLNNPPTAPTSTHEEACLIQSSCSEPRLKNYLKWWETLLLVSCIVDGIESKHL